MPSGLELKKFTDRLCRRIRHDAAHAADGSADKARAHVLCKDDGKPIIDFGIVDHDSADMIQNLKPILGCKPGLKPMVPYRGAGIARFLCNHDLIVASLCNVPSMCLPGVHYELLPPLSDLPKEAAAPRRGAKRGRAAGPGVGNETGGAHNNAMPRGFIPIEIDDAFAIGTAIDVLHREVLPRVPGLDGATVQNGRLQLVFDHAWQCYSVQGKTAPRRGRACIYQSGEPHKNNVSFSIRHDHIMFHEFSGRCKSKQPYKLPLDPSADFGLRSALYFNLLPAALRAI